MSNYLKFNDIHLTRIVDSKFSEFMKLFNQFPKSAILAGGALRGIYNKEEEIADFDIYFIAPIKTKKDQDTGEDVPVSSAFLVHEQAINEIHNILTGGATSWDNIIEVKTSEDDFTLVFKCPNNFLRTYKNKRGIKVQLITIEQHDSIESLFSKFDLDASCHAYDREFIYSTRAAIRNVRNKKITINNPHRPKATMKRLLKYQKKGYVVTNDAIDSIVDFIYESGQRSAELDGAYYID